MTTSHNSTCTDSTDHSTTPRVRWPYKQLWNLLRGEWILADDEVILEELKVSYQDVMKGLTLYQKRGTQSTTTHPVGKDLQSRISQHLDLEASIAWELFCSFMMFEYKGGSTSFEKLVDTSKVSNDFLSDLKIFYEQERTSILLCLQALLGSLNDGAHKYNHIFEAFKDWADVNGAADMTRNLIKSLDVANGESEEVEVLHALSILMYQMPHLSVQIFLDEFKGFKPGNKKETVLRAEATVLYSALLVPGFPTPDFPDEFNEGIEKFLLSHVTDLVQNQYGVGAVVGGLVSAAHSNPTIQKGLTSSPHPSSHCLPRMTELARHYSQDGILNRHNLSEVVLKGVYDATKAIFDHLDSAIPYFGSKDDYYDLLVTVLRHKAVTKVFLVDKPDLMNFYTDAMVLFPLELKWLLGMWGSMCSTVQDPEDAGGMLEDFTALVTSVSEYSTDPALAYVSHHSMSTYKNQKERRIAGILVPVGAEMAYLLPNEKGDCFLVAWDLKTSLPITTWEIILEQILLRVSGEIQIIDRGTVVHLDDSSQLWTQREQESENITSIVQFLINFAAVSSKVPQQLEKLYHVTSSLLLRTLGLMGERKEKAKLAADVCQLLTAAMRMRDKSYTYMLLTAIWPGGLEATSCIEDVIMGYESVVSNDCRVTISFLKSILAFFENYKQEKFEDNIRLKRVAMYSVGFVTENVFHSFTRWRMESEEVKLKLLVNCLKMYNALFGCEDEDWRHIKLQAAAFLFKSSSSLMKVLSTDEVMLQDSIVKPERGVYLIPEVIYESLALLLKLFQFQRQSIQMVDVSLGLTLVQKLGRFARHRLDYKIPTLAMSLLKKIAEDLNMSLLSCFGSDEVAFRDLILQRLEFRSEDVNLKVAILEFLTVAVHTQPGLIQYVFMEEVLSQKIVDLPLEKEESLSLSVLLFFRALFSKGAQVVKKCKNLWQNVFSPVKQLRLGGRVKIITYTLHISTLELYGSGMIDPVFLNEIHALLEEKQLLKIATIAMADQTDIGCKCLFALKHFLTVVLDRNDFTEAFPETTRKSLLDLVSERFWEYKDEEVIDVLFATPMADMMCLLSGSISEYPEYFEKLSEMLRTDSYGDCITVQQSLLNMTNASLIQVSSPLKAVVVENIVRVVARVFTNVAKHYDTLSLSLIHPLFRVAAHIISNIMRSKFCAEWERSFSHHLLHVLVVSVANLGIVSGKGGYIVRECVEVMLGMSDCERGCKMLKYSDLSSKLWVPMGKFATPEVTDSDWETVYVLSLHLMTKLLEKEPYLFLEEGLNYWVLHGTYILHRLSSLSEMTKHCSPTSPERNYTMMMNFLNFNVFVMGGIAAMIPYYQEWKMKQEGELRRIMEGVFTALSTCINLLNQPHYLNTLITFSTIQTQPPSLDVRVTPQLLELQAKLWEIMGGSCLIYWKLRGETTEFVNRELILAGVHQVAQAAIKRLTKSDKNKGALGGGGCGQLSGTLERALCIYHYHGHLILQDPNLSTKQLQTFKREIATDLSALCDSLRRISSNNPFLAAIANSLETSFK